MKQLPLVISLLALAGVIVLFVRLGSVGEDRKMKADLAPSTQEEAEPGEEIEIAIIMGRIQRFHQKFWLALRASNAELAQFYLHEMEEAMEEIANANVVEDGVDISANIRTYGLQVNEHLQKKLKDEGVPALHAESELLVKSCNSCHNASGYGLIEIRVPQDFSIPDQEMAPSASNQ